MAALATTHTPSELSLMSSSLMQRVLGRATSTCLCQLASQWFQCTILDG
eukprot:COSAG02_NODE_34_length_49821_cov_105.420438_52_plen_49_part_00